MVRPTRSRLVALLAGVALITALASGVAPQEGDPGATVLFVIGTARIDQFGREHAVLDDSDGDGVREVAVSGRRSARSGPTRLR